MNTSTIDESILRTIDKAIPYHILYALEYEGKFQIWIPFKEKSTTGGYKTGSYYHTDWQSEDDLKLTINGLTMRELYEGLVRQIAKDAIEKDDDQTSSNLKDSIEKTKKEKGPGKENRKTPGTSQKRKAIQQTSRTQQQAEETKKRIRTIIRG